MVVVAKSNKTVKKGGKKLNRDKEMGVNEEEEDKEKRRKASLFKWQLEMEGTTIEKKESKRNRK